MEPFRHRGLGELWLAGLNKPLFRFLMKLQGIHDTSSVTTAELDAILELMRGDDRGRSFLKIMRSTERTPEKQALYRGAVRTVPYPVQIIWGADDPALPLHAYGAQAQKATGLPKIQTVPAKHFLQEDQPAAIADHIAALVKTIAP